MQWTEDQVDRLYQAIGDQIKAARTKNKVTQTDLGKRIGLTRSSIANIEAGRQRVMLHWLFQIAQELNIPPHALIVAPDGLQDPDDALGLDRLEGQTSEIPDFVSTALRRAVSE
jgi:transcriptional regulator with XRE-family HTH domain